MAKRAKKAADCGVAGKTARSVIRSLLGGQKVAGGRDALIHLKRCTFCQTRIKNQIADARKGMKKRAYLDSLPETLHELEKLVS